MRIGQVIGKVTLSVYDEALRGGRWLLVHPVSRELLNDCIKTPAKLTEQSTLVVYDALGAGTGDVIGYTEGAEATAPFEHPIPIDAINLAIFDTIHYEPAK